MIIKIINLYVIQLKILYLKLKLKLKYLICILKETILEIIIQNLK